VIKITTSNLNDLAYVHYDFLCKKFDFSIEKRLKISLSKYQKEILPIYKKYYLLLQYIDKNLEEIIIGTPLTLEKHRIRLTKLSEDFELTKQEKKKTKEQKEILKDLNYIFNYETFASKGFRKKATKKHEDYFYSGNVLVGKINIQVCPYCNRNTIYSFKSGTKRTSELDHFYPQKKYPFFALSFYNLIPSCKVCNKIKLDNDDKEYINPYDTRFDFNKNMKFGLQIENSSFYYSENGFKFKYKFDAKISTDENQRIENNLNVFELKDLYDNHKDIILELIQKAEIYNESYIDELMQKYEGTLFKNREDLLRLVTCGYVSDEDLHKRPLSKLIKDISEELNLI